MDENNNETLIQCDSSNDNDDEQETHSLDNQDVVNPQAQQPVNQTPTKLLTSNRKNTQYLKRTFMFNKRPGKPRKYYYKIKCIGSLMLASWVPDDSTIDYTLQSNKIQIKKETHTPRRQKHKLPEYDDDLE